MASKKKASKKKAMTGKTVKIPEDQFDIIKAFVDENNYKIGGFVSLAALEKIGRLRKSIV